MKLNEPQVHGWSVTLGTMFAKAYESDRNGAFTWALLEAYKECRRLISRNRSNKRFGSYEAYASTQGI